MPIRVVVVILTNVIRSCAGPRVALQSSKMPRHSAIAICVLKTCAKQCGRHSPREEQSGRCGGYGRKDKSRQRRRRRNPIHARRASRGRYASRVASGAIPISITEEAKRAGNPGKPTEICWCWIIGPRWIN